MGPLPQEIGLVIHVGYAGHEGSKRSELGRYSKAAAPSAYCQQIPRPSNGRHGASGEPEPEI